MNSLTLAMKSNPESGVPQGSPFRGLTGLGAHHRRGEVSLLAGASGGGKSAYATHFAVNGSSDGSKIPTLYFSCDTPKMTLGTRIAAGILNKLIVEVEHKLRDQDPETWGLLNDNTQNIWFCWESEPSLRDVFEEVKAYAYVHGEYPHLIVIDNLINIDPEGEPSHVQKDMVMQTLQKLAQETNAHVMVLHHVTGAFVNGDEPIPKAGLLDKPDKRARLVLTFYKITDNIIGICVVKNTIGPAAADASLVSEVAFMPERSWWKG